MDVHPQNGIATGYAIHAIGSPGASIIYQGHLFPPGHPRPRPNSPRRARPGGGRDPRPRLGRLRRLRRVWLRWPRRRGLLAAQARDAGRGDGGWGDVVNECVLFSGCPCFGGVFEGNQRNSAILGGHLKKEATHTNGRLTVLYIQRETSTIQFACFLRTPCFAPVSISPRLAV